MQAQTIETLNRLLADYQVFYQKLRNYHWSVRGPFFFGLHAQFETMYVDAAGKVDELAERIAALGGRPASTLGEILGLTRLKEDADAPAAQEMVRNVLGDLEDVTGSLRDALDIDEVQTDSATANLLEGFADSQEKTAWMLRSFLET